MQERLFFVYKILRMGGIFVLGAKGMFFFV